MSYKFVTECRACRSKELIPVFDLGLQPLANEFRDLYEDRSGFFPLSVLLCPKCTLSQLSIEVDGELLYRDYKYVTSASNTMMRHFERLLQDLESEAPEKRICEIGSNDGLLLSFAHKRGYRVLGIEPALNLAALTAERGIQTIDEFFDQKSAHAAKDCIGNPAIILARHCFAHAPNWAEWIAGFEILTGPKTVIALEVPYVHDTLSKCELDTIYHEHLSYVSITAIQHLLKESPFHVHRVIRYGIHGGTLLIMLRHKDSGIERHLSADEYLAEDVVTVEHWEKFSHEAHRNIIKLGTLVRDHVSNGKRVCGFGASAKATVWISACGFTEKDLLFVSDNSPLKPGTLIPGKTIPVIAQDEFLSEHPDYAVMFCWNYKSEVMESNKKWRDRGGKFIVPCV
jgi:novobiocin biosynthesis protein NovU/D-mycarose 3-C-methyltransferase